VPCPRQLEVGFGRDAVRFGFPLVPPANQGQFIGFPGELGGFVVKSRIAPFLFGGAVLRARIHGREVARVLREAEFRHHAVVAGTVVLGVLCVKSRSLGALEAVPGR
jgi:hypothetical protein